jgi:UDP-glucose 4-epimerase
MKVLVTGATGFIGSHLCHALKYSGIEVVTWSLSQDHYYELLRALDSVDCVVHLAALVHHPEINNEVSYQDAIVNGTQLVVEACLERDVKRLIYMSSIAVYGVDSCDYKIFENSSKCPCTPYGRAKRDVEWLLKSVAENSDLEIVVIRAPLVYGKKAKGNYAELVSLMRKIPLLPFGRATEKRSFISIGALTSFIQKCVTYKNAFGYTVFNVQSNDVTSTKELCELIKVSEDICTLLVPVPRWVMRLLLTVIGKRKLYDKLFGRLELDCTKSEQFLKLHE